MDSSDTQSLCTQNRLRKETLSKIRKGGRTVDTPSPVSDRILEGAFGGLVHDVGKPLQRSHLRSDLNERELQMTPFNNKRGFHTHLHSGYTSRFLQKHLKMFNAFEAQVSGHHLSDDRELASWIREADRLASAIDRKDNAGLDGTQGSKAGYQQVRLSSVFSEVDFGRKKEPAWFPLSSLSELDSPLPETGKLPAVQQSVQEYSSLMDRFLQEVDQSPLLNTGNLSRESYERMYALMNQYMTTVPASTFEEGRTFVSLFDHSKLTSAVAACKAACPKDSYRMLEFDVSGIQKFIFKVTEGSDTKKQIAKSLRGRSLMISLITDAITMSYLHAFGLPEANIIFNTGGGALLLLPDTDSFDETVKKVSSALMKDLFRMFGTDITFVYADTTCTGSELQTFKADKAIELKAELEEAKTRKFSLILNEELFYQPAEKKNTCTLCGSASKDTVCPVCQTILDLSSVLVDEPDPVILFFFGKEPSPKSAEGARLQIGDCTVWLAGRSIAARVLNQCDYAESINEPWMGQTRFIASSVPISPKGDIIPLDEICETLIDQKIWGDPKLGILKMDVDNLGSIFAYGMKAETRSLSKFLTLSRLLEVFFGKILVEICEDVSAEITPDIDERTENGTMFYINYAGGDDLVIMGPAAGILLLTERIHQKLSEFVKNENITISAGIWIQRPHEPVRFGIQNAEKLLKQSKSAEGKNSVTLLNTTVSFPEFERILESVNTWIQYIDENAYSRTGFYRLMKLVDVEGLSDAQGQREYARRIPIALYTVLRNAKDRSFKEQIQQRLSEVLPVIGRSSQFKIRLQTLLLEMKLTIMQTRETSR